MHAVAKRRSLLPAEQGNPDVMALLLSSLPYLKRRIYLRTPPNNYPRFLYKYIYPHQERDEILENYFINSCIPLRSATSFNDPFDTAMKVTMDGTIQEKRKRFKEIIKRMRPDLSRMRLENETTRAMTDSRGTIEHITDIHRKNIHAMGVSCFSLNPRNVLMWSHYAYHHKGFVLQFEIARDTQSFLRALPVKYKKDYPILNFLKNRDDIVKHALQKFRHWKYEKEWRIVRPEGAGTFFNFEPASLTGVILGSRIEADMRNNLNSILKKRDQLGITPLRTYIATLHDSQYRILINKVIEI